jgi:AcrR family transcriptional regulator
MSRVTSPARSRNAGPGPSKPRRAPRPEERQRDAERTRRRILDAAFEEFAANGFAGARVAEIAKRAGVNAQLITYYFDGKRGLYDALRETWTATEATFSSPEQPFGAVISGYLDTVLDRPALARLLLWQALDTPTDEPDPAQAEQVRRNIEDIRRRQHAGELTNDIDAETILVVIWAATMAPVSIPHIVEAALGQGLTASTARARYTAQLKRLLRTPTAEATNNA